MGSTVALIVASFAVFIVLGVVRTWQALNRVSLEPPELLGYSIQRTVHAQAQGRSSVIYWNEYAADLPAPLTSLNLVDSEARYVRESEPGLQLTAPPPAVGAPMTDDMVFNGLFDFTEYPSNEVGTTLNRPQVRRLLQRLSEGFGGLWVDHGTVRLLQKTTMDDETNDSMTAIDMEAIASILYELEQALQPETVLDFEEHVVEPDEEVVEVREGQW